MKRFSPVGRLAAAISLLLSTVIWLSPAGAATAPQITWLGELSGGGLVSPRAIDVDGQGNLFVADQVARSVFKFDRYGRQVASLAVDLASGKGVAVTPDGQTLYVSTRNQGVAIVNVASGSVSGYLSGANVVDPGEIDLDAAGYVFVADNGAAQANVKIFFPNGTFKAAFGGAGTANGQFKSIAALAVNPHAQLVYAASNLTEVPRMQVFDLNGAYQASVANSTLYDTDNNTARGIAFEARADGRAYVLRYLPVALRVFDAAFTARLSDFGNVSGKLRAPVDAAFDAATGRLFVSDAAGIDIFGIDGGATPPRVNSAPSAPVPTSPVAGTAVASAAPVLAWSAATDADGDSLTYNVTVLAAGATVFTATTSATTLTVPENTLQENGSYVWTVQASDGQAESSLSAEAAFIVNAVDEAPTTPVAVAPLAGEPLGDGGSLAWNASTDPDPNDALLSYRLEVAADAAFAELVSTQVTSGTSLPVAELAGYADLAIGTGYYWRVTALDSDGTASVASAVGNFVYNAQLLRVTANVKNAVVTFYGNHGYAGQLVGTTPLVMRNPAPGPYTVVVERAGFETSITQVLVPEGGGATVAAELAQAYSQASFANGFINGAAGLAVGANAAPFLVDFDNDGLLDLLVGDAAGQVTLFPALQLISNYKLAFQAGGKLALPILPGAVPFVADWNNDGRKDLLVGQADGTIKLFVNAGADAAPVFDGGQDLTVGGSVLSVAAAAAPAVIDLNGDGAKDLVVGSGSGKVYAFVNQGSDAAPQLAAGEVLFEVAGAAQVTSADWDADGDRDLLVTAGGQTAIYQNAQGAFAAAGGLPIAGAFGVAAVDVNGANGKDLIIGQADGKLAYNPSSAQAPAGAAVAYLLSEWDEISLLVAAESPAALAHAGQVGDDLAAGRYNQARNKIEALARQLRDSETRAAVLAFAELL